MYLREVVWFTLWASLSHFSQMWHYGFSLVGGLRGRHIVDFLFGRIHVSYHSHSVSWVT